MRMRLETNAGEEQIQSEVTQLLQQDGAKIVITGDSMSFNRYDFDPVHRVNAYDCLPGIASWSFLLRDAIHRNDPSFLHGDEVIVHKCMEDTVLAVSAMPVYTFPFDNRALTARIFHPDEELIFTTKPGYITEQIILYLGSVPQNTAARFDIYVDGEYRLTVDNNGDGQPFQGYNPLQIKLPVAAGAEHEIRLTHWQQSAAIPCGTQERTFHLLGIGSRQTEIHLTGQGARTAEWMLEHLHERITFCTPDLVVLIIGANDRAYRTVEQFASELDAVLSGIRQANNRCHIILISPPSAVNESDPETDDIPYTSERKAQQYNEVLRSCAVRYQCLFVDLLRFFADIPMQVWRFDNIHFTKKGNSMLAEAMIREWIGPAQNHDSC